MKIAVSNSSPLILLAKIKRLDFLFEIFSCIYIPHEVFEEVVVKGKEQNMPDALQIEKYIDSGQISIQLSPKNIKTIPNLDFSSLHPGELAAIQLAYSMPENLILLDDQDARDIARALNLKVKGTLGILIELYDLKKLTQTQAIYYLEQLNDLMYLSGDLYKTVLKYLV